MATPSGSSGSRAPTGAFLNMDTAYEAPFIGRSRKNRLHFLSNQGSTPLGIAPSLITFPNPVVPLAFESIEGVSNSQAFGDYSYICMEQQGLQTHFEDHYISPQVFRGHCMALSAYGCRTRKQAEQEAHKAIKVAGGLCPEAYNVLAVAAANSYEEALQYYQTATEQGPRILQPGLFEDALEEKQLWMKSPFRALFRGLYGVANTLRKMGRYEESLPAYERLLKLDSNWYQFSSYVNVFSTYPLALLGAKGAEAVLEWMRRLPSVTDQFTYLSSGLYFAATAALAELEFSAAKGRLYFGSSTRTVKYTAENGWAADGLDLARVHEDMSGWDYVKAGKAVHLLCWAYPDAVDMILGDKALPKGLQASCNGPAPTAAAVSYVYTAGSQWRSRLNGVAMDRLRRHRNTLEVRSLIWDLRSMSGGIDVANIKHYLSTNAGGFHKGAMERDQGADSVRCLVDLLMTHPDGTEFKDDQVKVLGWLLDAGCPLVTDHAARPPDTALHMDYPAPYNTSTIACAVNFLTVAPRQGQACYQAYGPQVVKLLLAAGADPLMLNKQGLSAIGMAANQGNWREMRAVLEARPELKTATGSVGYSAKQHYGALLNKLTVPELMICDLFNSSCLPCLSGGPCCMRCGNGIPHSKYASFYTFFDILLEEVPGLKLSKSVLDEMAGSARANGPNSPWAKLQKHILRGLASAQKAAHGALTSVASSIKTSAGPGAGGNGGSSSTTAGADNRTAGQGSAGVAAAASSSGSSSATVKQCWACGVVETPLQICSGCRKAYYCR
eukprot:gene11519-11662_t